VQYDYLRAWLALRMDRPEEAREIAASHAAHPALRWRRLFARIADTVDPAGGGLPGAADPDSREQALENLAAAAPALDMEMEGPTVTLRFQNLSAVTVRYYRMDLELLFSRAPFAQDFSSRFEYVAPNAEETITLPAGGTHRFTVPEALRRENVLVEVTGEGVTRARPYLAGALAVRAIEPYGQLRVARADGGAPAAKAYVKVYARDAAGRASFYKDGYTDFRGLFDYATLSTGGLETVERFALLVMNDDDGAALLEAAPPRR
jgi:hypothetical protein